MNNVGWFIWLLPAVALPLLAVIGVSIYSRPRRDDEPTDSVARHEQFRRAMDSQLGTPKPPAPPAPPAD